jgi:hypothetical protein
MSERQIRWGGRVGVVNRRGDRCYAGIALGTFEGQVPAALEHWVASTVLQCLEVLLAASNRPDQLARDAPRLGAALGAAVAPDLEAQGVTGTLRLTELRLVCERGDEPPVAPVSAHTPAMAAPAMAAPAVAAPFVVPPAPPPTPMAPPPPLVVPPAAAPARAIDTTADAIPAFVIDEPLPFRPGPAGATPPPSSRSGPHPDVGETAFLPPIEGLDDPLPFAQAADLPELSLEQYASLCVERMFYPAEQQAVLARYRVLTEQAMAALDGQWRARLLAEGALEQRWRQACARYEQWLRSRQ